MLDFHAKVKDCAVRRLCARFRLVSRFQCALCVRCVAGHLGTWCALCALCVACARVWPHVGGRPQ